MTNDDKTATWTKGERDLLDGLLDAIIPADADSGLPAAGALGVADFLAQQVQETPALGDLLAQGLTKAAALVEKETGDGLESLTPEEREAVARKLEASDHDFFMTLVRLTYIGYYTHPAIPPHFGLPDHPPQPEGNDLPPDDPAELAKMLETVRNRGKIWRDC